MPSQFGWSVTPDMRGYVGLTHHRSQNIPGTSAKTAEVAHSMAEWQILFDAINIGGAQGSRFAQRPPPFRTFALKQMPPPGASEHYLAASGDFETLGHGLPCFIASGTPHIVLLSRKSVEIPRSALD
jgi:hypothetical protein